MSIWFTSDTHFGHRNIIEYAKRPFKNVDEMDSEMVKRWNQTVGTRDVVYIVGDFALCREKRAAEIRDSLNGVLYLVRGNHDKGVDERMFEWVRDYYVVKVPDEDAHGGLQRIVLLHYAMRVWDKSHYGSWHLYGHSHGTLPEDPNSRSFDIGVDSWDFRPVSYERVKEKMLTKNWKPIDHHEYRE